MMPPSTTPAVGEARSHETGHGYGMVLFASILLVVIGCFNLIQGIAAIAHSHVFVANAHYLFANQRTWGWITVILGCLLLLAAVGVLAGNQLARWFAVVMLGLNAIDQMRAGHWVLDRRRLADWKAEWATVGPQRTRRFRSRG
jgi:hypothetical protein